MLCKLVYFALYFIILFSLSALFGYSDSSNDLDAYFTLPFVVLVHASSNSSPTEDNGCVSYNQAENTIVISCDDIRLTDIDREINDPLVLVRNYNGEEGVWFLNANVVINKDSTFVVDPQDTKWLKISAGGDDAHSIQVFGSLKIDSVKVTSWNPEINNYTKFRLDNMPENDADEFSEVNRIPRPYIVVDEANGSTNITNSEIAYLGYDCSSGRCHGLAFYGDSGKPNIVRANNIHHNNFGYYSNNTGAAILEDNHVHHNYVYGFDPHTDSHDLVIRNNTVHDNGSIGIICSLDCFNITIENNIVHNNTKAGVMLSRLTYNSVVRNNTISDENAGISISESYNNKIYNNTVFDIMNGIELKANSYDNVVQDNKIERPLNHGIRISGNTTGNTLESNKVIDILDHARAVSVAKELANVNIVKENEILDLTF
jgi:mannuronan 5-epimerase